MLEIDHDFCHLCKSEDLYHDSGLVDMEYYLYDIRDKDEDICDYTIQLAIFNTHDPEDTCDQQLPLCHSCYEKIEEVISKIVMKTVLKLRTKKLESIKSRIDKRGYISLL